MLMDEEFLLLAGLMQTKLKEFGCFISMVFKNNYIQLLG